MPASPATGAMLKHQSLTNTTKGFLDLPGELRNKVYGLHYPPLSPSATLTTIDLFVRDPRTSAPSPNLTFTTHWVRKEALDYYLPAMYAWNDLYPYYIDAARFAANPPFRPNACNQIAVSQRTAALLVRPDLQCLTSIELRFPTPTARTDGPFSCSVWLRAVTSGSGLETTLGRTLALRGDGEVTATVLREGKEWKEMKGRDVELVRVIRAKDVGTRNVLDLEGVLRMAVVLAPRV